MSFVLSTGHQLGVDILSVPAVDPIDVAAYAINIATGNTQYLFKAYPPEILPPLFEKTGMAPFSPSSITKIDSTIWRTPTKAINDIISILNISVPSVVVILK